jgi:type II secretory pathway pseudopilin PulG
MPSRHPCARPASRARSTWFRHQSGLSLLELTLVLAISLIIVSGTLYQARQANLDSRIQASKIMLNLVRSELATYRYRNGRYPTNQAEFQAMPAPPGVPASRWLVEPVSGTSAVIVIPPGTATNTGGWIYTPGANATVSVNLAPASLGGEDPATW